MKVHIHPHYAAYESYIRAIPSEEYEREEVYCNRRNTVERVRFGDKDFVINRDRPSGSLYRNQKEWFLPHRILYFRIPPLPACYGYVRYGNGGRREKTAKT